MAVEEWSASPRQSSRFFRSPLLQRNKIAVSSFPGWEWAAPGEESHCLAERGGRGCRDALADAAEVLHDLLAPPVPLSHLLWQESTPLPLPRMSLLSPSSPTSPSEVWRCR